jgi:hypothetical protein
VRSNRRWRSSLHGCRERNGYPSDLRDAEWARLAPLIPRGVARWATAQVSERAGWYATKRRDHYLRRNRDRKLSAVDADRENTSAISPCSESSNTQRTDAKSHMFGPLAQTEFGEIAGYGALHTGPILVGL